MAIDAGNEAVQDETCGFVGTLDLALGDRRDAHCVVYQIALDKGLAKNFGLAAQRAAAQAIHLP